MLKYLKCALLSYSHDLCVILDSLNKQSRSINLGRTRAKLPAILGIVWDTRFWRRWRCWRWPPGLCRRVNLQVDTNVSEKHSACIFSPEDGDNMLLRNVSTYKLTRRYNPGGQHRHIQKYYPCFFIATLLFNRPNNARWTQIMYLYWSILVVYYDYSILI
jgi:hypothetical protein